MTPGEPPPYAFELCPSCGRDVVLATHDLSCLQHDPRIRVAVAWICDDCNLVLGIVGLFTSWTAAIYAHQDELDQRAAAYFNVASNGGADVPSSPPTAAETSSRNPADVAPLSAAANSLSESAQLKNH